MPVVDDLVVSVRIDPASDLANLKNQLDSLVGKKGEKKPLFQLPVGLKADVDFIKDRIITITQNVFGRSQREVVLNAIAILRKIESAGGFDKLKDDIEATAEEIDAIQGIVRQFGAGIVPNIDKANKILARLNLAVTQENVVGRKERRTIIQNIIKSLDENKFLRDNLVKLAGELGIPVIPEFKLFRLGDALQKIEDMPDDVSNTFKDFIDENTLDKIQGITEEQKNQLNDLFKGINIIEDLAKAFEVFGIEPTKEIFKEKGTILKEPKLKAILGLMFKRILKGELEAIPEGFKESMIKVLEDAEAQTKFITDKIKYSLDILVLKADKELMEKLLPEARKELQNIRENLVVLPLKTSINSLKGIIDDIEERAKIAGKEGVLPIGINVTELARQRIDESIPLIAINIIKRLEEFGLRKDLVEKLDENLEVTKNSLESVDIVKDKVIEMLRGMKEFEPIINFLKGEAQLKTQETEQKDEVTTMLREQSEKAQNLNDISLEISKRLDPENFAELTSAEVMALLRELMLKSNMASDLLGANFDQIVSGLMDIQASLNATVAKEVTKIFEQNTKNTNAIKALLKKDIPIVEESGEKKI